MSFPNNYIHRKVAETSQKSCEICFKLSTSVLITPDNKDFFYVCPSHLKDTGFCTPVVDQAALEARKKKELEAEVERVKKEYEEKQRKKKEKEKKDAENSGEKGKDKESKKDEDKKDEKATPEVSLPPVSRPHLQHSSRDDRSINANSSANHFQASKAKSPEPEEEPRVFELKRMFYQQRVDKKRQAEIAKRNRERLQNPNFFPSVPKGLP
ncbi:VPS4-associated protein 1 [Coniochaeta sp. 2T2.1]|nr:VPS4-associated protein 1 [Coniochaeta sp. 2T2.1]